MTLDLGIVLVYLVVIFGIGLWAGRQTRSFKGYAVAGRSFGAFVLFATLSASFIGGGFSFGNADTVFQNGIGTATALWGFSLMLFLVSVFIAPRMGVFADCLSVGDIMRRSYGKTGQLIAGILGTVICMGILGAQVGAMGAVFTAFTPLTYMEGVFLGCSIVIFYTSFGGMKAVVITDVIQFLMLVVFIPLTLFMGIDYIGGWSVLEQKVPPHLLSFTNENFTPLMWVSLFLSFLIGETLVPPYVQRLLIAKNVRATVRGTVASAVLSVPFFVMTGLIGVLAFVMNSDIASHLALPTVIHTVLPVGLKGLAIAAIISIVMSTADSFLNASSVCLIEDVLKPITGRQTLLSDRDDLVLAQLISLIVGMCSLVVALCMTNVLDILLFSYQFWAPVVLVPLVAVLVGFRPSKTAFLTGAFAGAVTVIVGFVLHQKQMFGIDVLVVATMFNLMAFLSVGAARRLCRTVCGK